MEALVAIVHLVPAAAGDADEAGSYLFLQPGDAFEDCAEGVPSTGSSHLNSLSAFDCEDNNLDLNCPDIDSD
jgi:hypothetical protein